MSQRKTSRQCKSGDEQNEDNRMNYMNIKTEPAAEFLCVLPTFNHDRTLLGNIKVKIEKSESEEPASEQENKKTNSKFFSRTDKRVKCPICLIKVKYLQTHLKYHKIKSEEPKFECKTCSKNISRELT